MVQAEEPAAALWSPATDATVSSLRRFALLTRAVNVSSPQLIRWWLGLIGLLLFVALPWWFAGQSREWRNAHDVLSSLLGPLGLLALTYTAGFLSIFVHEAGHGFFGRLVGIRIEQFVVGVEAPLSRSIGWEFGSRLDQECTTAT